MTIEQLIDSADELTEQGQYAESLEYLRQAVALAPDPFEDHPKAMELLMAIGDNYFFMGAHEKAQQVYQDVMLLGDAPANAYVRLRRGQIAFELGDMKKAKIELACAYMNGGKEIFEGEYPKYLMYVRSLFPYEL